MGKKYWFQFCLVFFFFYYLLLSLIKYYKNPNVFLSELNVLSKMCHLSFDAANSYSEVVNDFIVT